jgi:hypothetical protein
MPSVAMLIVAVCAVIACLLLPSYAAPSARLIQTSEAFPSKSSPDRLVLSSVPLQSAPEPGIVIQCSAHTASTRDRLTSQTFQTSPSSLWTLPPAFKPSGASVAPSPTLSLMCTTTPIHPDLTPERASCHCLQVFSQLNATLQQQARPTLPPFC